MEPIVLENVSAAASQLEPDAGSVDSAAAAVGATDMFVFRRITADRFVHVGGVGRGESWAGNVNLIIAEEGRAAAALAAGCPSFMCAPEPVRVFGPYYQREAVLVPLSHDLLVVFGSGKVGALSTSPAEVTAAARAAADGIEQVSSAKRLADELELLHAVRSLAQTSAVRIHEVMKHVVQSSLAALSCDLCVLYVSDLDAVEVAEHGSPTQDPESLLPAMRALFADATRLPACVQDSAVEPPPEPLSAWRVTSHYVLAVGSPPFGVLALMHTEVRPRGFTLLCREVGLRMAESAEPILRAALTLHELETQLDRVGRDARMDPLTKLPNRRAWEETLEAHSGPAGLIIVDADGLKTANDERGHHFGDEFLQAVAQTVSAALAGGDVLARVGGDEFAVLLPGAGEARSNDVAGRIDAALQAHPGLDSYPLSASVGYAAAPPAESLAHAQQLADKRMYETKNQ
jgi:diguanylate cyclase (GGDEF)-like protein